MKSLPNELATVKSRDEFHSVTEQWCLYHRFHYDMQQSIRRNIKSARTQGKFLVAVALSEAEKIYDNLGV